jgi:hypothetical protein
MANPNKHPVSGKFSGKTPPGLLPHAHHAKMVKTALNVAQMTPRQHAAKRWLKASTCCVILRRAGLRVR